MLSRVASTDHELEMHGGEKDREIPDIEMSIEPIAAGRRGELSREPVGDEGEVRAGGKGSTLEAKTSLRRRGL